MNKETARERQSESERERGVENSRKRELEKYFDSRAAGLGLYSKGSIYRFSKYTKNIKILRERHI